MRIPFPTRGPCPVCPKRRFGTHSHYRRVGKSAPEISGQSWLNSKPLNLAELKGKVALVEFWTFGCYNCRNVELHVKQWHQKSAARRAELIRLGKEAQAATE